MPNPPTFDPLPEDVASLLDPGWLAAALDLVADEDRIVAVEPVSSSRTVAEKVRFVVDVDGPAGRRRHPLCAKGHFGDGLTSLRTEAHVYRDLRPLLDIGAPWAHYTAVDDATGRGLVVMDDVVGLGGRFLGAQEPYSVATCRDSLAELASVHARTWDDETWDVAWLAPRIESMASMFPAEVLQQLLDDGRGPDLPPVLPGAAPTLQAAMHRSAEVPLTCVIHGDTHSGNAYVDAGGNACWLDWQITQRGHWSTDVSYHLGTVLDVATRRAHEVDLLHHYLDQLAARGVVAPSFDEAWERYTLGFTWGYFLWVITRISSREVVLLHIPRLGAALTDHDTFRRLGVA